ncbi:aromatic ring-hydroxylating dioxygenase subunit alpha, partial [Pseudomonas aeruginosa]
MSEYIETDDASYFRVRRQAYVSAELHRRELHEIFDDSWLYAAHLSELREPGDFITRDVGGRNLIIQRRADGEPAVYLNACAHRGAKVCAERQGNSQRFTCPYHGWTYDSHGSLIGLPDKAAYQHAGQCHPELSLTRVKHAVYRNFLFIHYGARQASLETYLGQAKDYIDLICDQSEAELEIIPGGFEHSIKANWKLLAENGVDAYHLPFAHKRYLEYLNSLGTDPESHKRHGRGEALGNGHA